MWPLLAPRAVTAAALLALAPRGCRGAALGARLPTNPFCAYESNVDVIRADLFCVNGVIDSVAAFFGKPGGSCGSFAPNPDCDLASFPAYAEATCLGQRNCTLTSQNAQDPCFGSLKAIAATAHCSEGPGGYAPATSPGVGAGYYMLQPVINGAVQPFGLRHCTGIASFDANPDGGDFLWRVTEGEDDDRAGISLQPNNYYFDALGWLGNPPVDPNAATNLTLGIVSASGVGGLKVPLADMSWWLIEGLDGSGLGFSLRTHSTSSAASGFVLSVTDCTTCPFCYKAAPFHLGDAILAPAGAAVAGNGSVLSQTFAFVPVAAQLGAGAPWSTDHANAQNTGNNEGDGPGETYSTCRQQMLKTDPLAAGAPRFLSSGVTSVQDSWWLGGSSDDSLWLLEDLAVAQQDDAAWQTFRLNLTQLMNVSAPATPYGVVGAPAATADVTGASYRVYVASANGYVACLDMMRCYSGATPGGFWRAGEEGAAGPAPAASARRRAGAKGVPGGVRGAPAPPPDPPAGSAELGSFSVSASGSSSASSASNAAQWVSYSNVNAVQNHWPPSYPYYINSTTQTWPECQALCWANHTASGGEPNGCVVWTWHDANNLAYSYQCWFKMTSGFVAAYEADHVTGFLSTGSAGDGCVVWARPISTPASSPGGALRPSYSSVRLAGASGEVLLVSETDADLDTGGVLHGISAANGSELFFYPALVKGSSVGLKGIVPATLAQSPSIALLAFGTRVVALDLAACVLAGPAAPCTSEIASYDSSGEPGGADSFVSSPVVRSDGSALYLHSSTGTLRKLSIAATAGRPTGFATQWACRYSRANLSICVPPTETTLRRRPGGARGAWEGELEEVRTAEYGGACGGFYQPTTRAERDELHAEIRRLHLARFGAARGAPASAAERVDAVAHAARLAHELPRAELLSIVTPSGYRRLGASGLPAPSTRVEDFGGLFPFATPSLWFDGSRIATVDFRLDVDSGLFIIDEGNGNPIDMGDGTTFSVFSLTLADGAVVPLGRSRSSPAQDRQGHIYLGSDTDLSGNASSEDTYPVIACVAVSKAVKWVNGLGERRVASVGAASPVLAVGLYQGRPAAYMASSDGVMVIQEAPRGYSCPTSSALLSCSGNGDCDCDTTACACRACWQGADPRGSCATYDPAPCEGAGNGKCTASGDCACSDACASGLLCDQRKDCRNGGTCSPADGSCSCDPAKCFSLNFEGLCEVPDSSLCGGQPCSAEGACVCSQLSCLTGPTCGAALDCTNGGSCSPGAGCSCAGTCFALGADGLCSAPIDCGPGAAGCSAGVCACAPCWSADALGVCSVPETCSYHGSCGGGGGAGTCACDAGYSSSTQCAACDDCSGGPTCADPVGDAARCSGNGRCTTTAAGSFSGCACSGGFSGPDCSVAPPAGASAGGAAAAAAPAVAAGVLVPLALALLGAVALRRAYPTLPLHEAAARAAGKLLSGGADLRAGAARLLPGSASASPRRSAGSPPGLVRDLSPLAAGAAGAAGAGAGASERASLLHSARTRAASSPLAAAKVGIP